MLQEARSAWSRPKPQPSLARERTAREGSSPPGAILRGSRRGLEEASWHGAWAAARGGSEGSGKRQAGHDGVDREDGNDEELWGNLYGSFAFDSQKERSGTDSRQSSLSGERGGESGEDGDEEACGGIGDPHFCPPPLDEGGDGAEEDEDEIVSDSEPGSPGGAGASWRPPQRSWAHREDATRDQLQELLEKVPPPPPPLPPAGQDF